MRTTLDLDDDLLRALLRRYPGVSKTEAVERAIRDHVERDAYDRVRALAGAFPDIEDVSQELRAIDRHS